ncbi:hypothetical protein CapIbe_022825 [Capra ibex]
MSVDQNKLTTHFPLYAQGLTEDTGLSSRSHTENLPWLSLYAWSVLSQRLHQGLSSVLTLQSPSGIPCPGQSAAS